MNNMLPTASAIAKELCKDYETRVEDIIEDTKVLEDLLKPIANHENKRLGMNHQPVQRPSSSRIKGSPQSKPLSQKHSFSSPNHSKGSPRRRNSVHEPPDDPTNIASCELEEMLKTKATKDLLDCAQSIDDYIEMRERPDKITDVRRQRLLLEIESNWLQEYETFSIFEPDLAESLYKYLSVLGKEGTKSTQASERSIRKKIINEPEVLEFDKFYEEAQKKINIGLNKDLASIDFENMKSEVNKKKVVELYRTVTAASDIKKLQSDIVFKKEPWFTLESKK